METWRKSDKVDDAVVNSGAESQQVVLEDEHSSDEVKVKKQRYKVEGGGIHLNENCKIVRRYSINMSIIQININ